MTADMALCLYNAAKAGIFAKRNTDKTLRGDVVRGGVAAGQATNVLKEVKNYDSAIGKGAGRCYSAISTAAKSKTILGYTAKGLQWASDHINPLICISGGVQVALADNKKAEAVKQTAALTGMFTLERTAKSILTVPGRKDLLKTTLAKKPYIRKILRFSRKLDALANHSGNKWAKFGIPIAKSLAFIGMSITGYSIGASLGEAINHNFDLDKPVKPNKKVAQPTLCYTA